MSKTKICRYCGNIIYSDAKTCQYCKKNLCKEHDNPDLVCAKCKAPVNSDDNFCQVCGAIFSLPETPITAEPVKGNMMGIPYNIGILLTSFAASFAATVYVASSKDTTIVGNCIFFSIAFIVAEVFFYIYFLPSIIAIEKNHPNTYFIYVANLLLGITVIGWFAVLIFVMSSNKE